jgi:hypothetical protein
MGDARDAVLDADSAQLSTALQRVATEYLVRRYSGPGNPMRCEILRLGDVVATKVPFVPNSPIMNSVHGLSDPADLPRVLEHYAKSNQQCWIDVSPTTATPELARALVDAG